MVVLLIVIVRFRDLLVNGWLGFAVDLAWQIEFAMRRRTRLKQSQGADAQA